MESRLIACNACGADDFAPTSTIDGWTIGRCRACGLVFVNPAPFFDPGGLVLGDVARVRVHGVHAPAHHARGPRLRTTAAPRQRGGGRPAARAQPGLRAADAVPRHRLRSGASVWAASALGWDAIGIDLDPQLIAEGREQLKVDLRCVPILECGLPPGEFDFIKLRDVIEHLPDPLDVLGKVREPPRARRSRPPGHAERRRAADSGADRPPTAADVRRGRPAPHHLHSFAPGTLVRTVRRAGLRPYTTFTTTPSDGRYVTSHNVVRAQGRPILRPLWWVGRVLGMGSVLVTWAGGSEDAAT